MKFALVQICPILFLLVLVAIKLIITVMAAAAEFVAIRVELMQRVVAVGLQCYPGL